MALMPCAHHMKELLIVQQLLELEDHEVIAREIERALCILKQFRTYPAS